LIKTLQFAVNLNATFAGEISFITQQFLAFQKNGRTHEKGVVKGSDIRFVIDQRTCRI